MTKGDAEEPFAARETLPGVSRAMNPATWTLALAQWPMAWRIALLALVPMALLAAGGGLWLRGQMQQSLHTSFEQVLREKTQRVLARLHIGPEGGLRESTGSADEFSAIYAGWYWRARSGSNVLRSRSLWDMDLPSPPPSKESASGGLLPVRGPLQEKLLAHVSTAEMGPDALPIELVVYGPAAPLHDNLQQIDRTLVLAGAMLMLLTGGLAWLQVRAGLAPLRRLEGLLAAMRSPQGAGADITHHLAEPTGRDLQPVQNELAGLLRHNAHVVARARAHAMDLNHALKKPLALLSAQAAAQAQVSSADVLRQVEAMAQLVDRYQARTLSDALHARPGVAGKNVDVRQCVEQVLHMMRRLYTAQDLEWSLVDHTDGQLLWRGERADLEEVLGNILDNAGKWAASRVRLSLRMQDDAESPRLLLGVEDDGPGMAAEQLQAAGQRGVRFDESVQGSGLGLAIASQISQAYDGSLQLSLSEDLGGLGVWLEMRGIVRSLARPRVLDE